VITTALGLWRRWQAHRDDWLALDANRQQLLTALPNRPEGPSAFRTSAERALEQADRAMTTSETPGPVREQLLQIHDALTTFREVDQQIQTLERQVSALNGAAAKPLRAQLALRRAELHALTVDNREGMTQLQAGLGEDRTAVEEALSKQEEVGAVPLGSRPTTPSEVPAGLQLPVIGPLLGSDISMDPSADGRQASRRLLIFSIVSFVIAIVGLVPLGFNQLYVANPTLGANPWLDYPAVIFWALGIEGSREAIRGILPGGTAPPPAA